MLKIKSSVIVVAMVPFVIGAQNLIKNGDAEENLEGWSGEKVRVVNDNPHSGKNCFKTIAPFDAKSSQIIPVDPSKSYKISGWVKSADDKKTDVYIGLMPLDENKIQILPEYVKYVAETETELAEACKTEDALIKVKDASKWKLAGKLDMVAFNVLDYYKDIPNSNISAGFVLKSEYRDNIWELTLDKPCGKDYPSGTKVRQHKCGGTLMYPITLKQFNSPEWKELTGKIEVSGKSASGVIQFWTGTKYVRVVVLALSGGNVYFDDLRLEAEDGVRFKNN